MPDSRLRNSHAALLPIQTVMKIILAVLLLVAPLFAQSNTGELRLKVTDPAGLGIKSAVELVSEANHYRQSFVTDDAGDLVVKRLAFWSVQPGSPARHLRSCFAID